MPNPKLQRTKDYSKFTFAKSNRDVTPHRLRPQHKALRESMKKYGWLPFEPIGVYPDNGKLVITEGQHRFTFARELGLEVYYVIHDDPVDIAEINQCSATWTVKDYCKKWIAEGHPEYQKAADFAEQYGLSITMAVAMLAGTYSWSNIKAKFSQGEFKITHEKFATRVASLYKKLCSINKEAKHNQCLNALWACCLTPYFEEERLIRAATNRPEMISRVGTREAWLEVLQEIYNFASRSKMPLAFDAEQAVAGNSRSVPKETRTRVAAG